MQQQGEGEGEYIELGHGVSFHSEVFNQGATGPGVVEEEEGHLPKIPTPEDAFYRSFRSSTPDKEDLLRFCRKIPLAKEIMERWHSREGLLAEKPQEEEHDLTRIMIGDWELPITEEQISDSVYNTFTHQYDCACQHGPGMPFFEMDCTNNGEKPCLIENQIKLFMGVALEVIKEWEKKEG